jgi:hypothetical protein
MTIDLDVTTVEAEPTWKERLVCCFACAMCCPVLGAVAVEFTRYGGRYDTFWQSVGSLSAGVGFVVFATLAVTALVGIFGAWAPSEARQSIARMQESRSD